MDLEIIDYLKTTASPEMADTYEKSFELLSRFNVDEYMRPFDQTYTLIDDYDLVTILERFDTDMNVALSSLLNQHGIFMDDQANISFMNDLLTGIQDIENYSDTGAVLDILHSGNSDEEKIADIFNLVTEHQAEEIMAMISRVNPGILRTIETLFMERQVFLESIIKDDTAATITLKAQRIRNLYSLITNEFKGCMKSALLPRLEEGLRFDMEFQFYWNLLWDEIAQLGAPDACRDLIGMAIISSDKSEKILETVKEYIGTHYSDLDEIGRLIDLSTRQFLISEQDNGVTLGSK